MQVSDQQPTEVRDIPETQDREKLSRAAHKIAWTRMNGSIEVLNPFVETDPSRFAPGDGRHETGRHR